ASRRKAADRDAQGNVLYQDTDARQVFYTDAIGFHYRDTTGNVVRDTTGAVAPTNGAKPVYTAREKRELKPIVYHLSPRFPKDLLRSVELIIGDHNKAFRRAAA